MRLRFKEEKEIRPLENMAVFWRIAKTLFAAYSKPLTFLNFLLRFVICKKQFKCSNT